MQSNGRKSACVCPGASLLQVQQLLGSWEEREAAAFLVDNMPPPDVGSLPDAYLATNVRLAMQVRH